MITNCDTVNVLGHTVAAKFLSAIGDIIGVINNSINLFFYLIGGQVFNNAFRKALHCRSPGSKATGKTTTDFSPSTLIVVLNPPPIVFSFPAK